MITHAFRFDDESAAVAALPQFCVPTDDGSDWDRSCVDGPIPVMRGTGEFVTDPETGEAIEIMEPVAGYHLNINLDALDDSLPGLIGAWDVPGHLVYGETPVTPMRVFA